MAAPEHLEKLKESVKAWNAWREKHPEIEPDLRAAILSGEDLIDDEMMKADLSSTNLNGADLSEEELDGVDFSGANLDGIDLFTTSLIGADFRGSRAQEANFAFADVSKARFEGANLEMADFSDATLQGTNLGDCRLVQVDFSRADLSLADLTYARVGYTTFGDNDLSTVKGLETIEHEGPSVVGVNTLLRSGGKVPESFLRGCGLPEDFIELARSLTTNPIDFHSCFISYATQDQEFADRLHCDLQGKGVRCWFAPHDVQGGRKLHDQIDEAIRLHDKLLLILSAHSMNSEWVKTEIAKARKREVREKRRVLFPIRLVTFEALRDWECFDADSGKDSAREIREYFIPDFSNWKSHDAYQEAFRHLLRDLKAQRPIPLA